MNKLGRKNGVCKGIYTVDERKTELAKHCKDSLPYLQYGLCKLGKENKPALIWYYK